MDYKKDQNHPKVQSKPVCPRCNSVMVPFKLGITCTNTECPFWVPREIRQKVLTKEIIADLLTKKKTATIKGFHKKGSSETFAAKLVLTDKWKIAIRLDGAPVLPCPKCGNTVERFDRGYKCMNTPACDFVLWDRFCGKDLTSDQMKAIITEKRTEIIHGFRRKKDGKMYSARIILKESGMPELEFEDNPPKQD